MTQSRLSGFKLVTQAQQWPLPWVAVAFQLLKTGTLQALTLEQLVPMSPAEVGQRWKALHKER